MFAKTSTIYLLILLSLVGCGIQPQPFLVRNPRWASDGNTLVMECSFGGWEYPDYEICMADSDLTHLVRLDNTVVSADWRVHAASWSPITREIAFRTTSALFIAVWPSGETQRILSTSCANPVWSADGQQIVCALGPSIYHSAEGSIAVVDVHQKNYLKLTSSSQDSFPAWVREDQAIVFFRRNDKQYSLYEIDLATKNETLLAASLDTTPAEIAVSPSSSLIAYLTGWNTGLVLLDLDTFSTTQLLTPTYPCLEDISQPHWSHSGQYLAFAAGHTQEPGMGLWVVDVLIQEVFQVAWFHDTLASAIDAPAWSPDDLRLATSVDHKLEIVSFSDTVSLPFSCD